MAGVFLDSNHLLCPSGGVWAEPSWFPFRDSGWLRPVIRRRGNKLLSGLCLCSRASLFHATLALPFFSFACVILPTISNTFEGHYHEFLSQEGLKGGAGWLLGSLVGRKHVPQNIHTTPSARSAARASVMAAQPSQRSSGDLPLAAR